MTASQMFWLAGMMYWVRLEKRMAFFWFALSAVTLFLMPALVHYVGPYLPTLHKP